MIELRRDPERKGHAFYQCDCGVVKSIYKSNVKHGKTKSCGCLNRRLSSERMRGENNCQYRSGEGISKGYRYIMAPDHPCKNTNGRVAEHRLIMENHIGRYLEPCEVVHHIDNDRLNNNIENLLLLPGTSEHTKLHNAARRATKNEVVL